MSSKELQRMRRRIEKYKKLGPAFYRYLEELIIEQWEEDLWKRLRYAMEGLALEHGTSHEIIWLAMWILGRGSGECKAYQRTIAHYTDLSRPTVNRYLKEMERNGWVDSRTEEGRKVYTLINKPKREWKERDRRRRPSPYQYELMPLGGELDF